ncbi:MAG: MerR family transcriptional regulator [Acidobacteria bacterium]|nr:MerR family transcriptional regulator [Acidobacteriota bacterium]
MSGKTHALTIGELAKQAAVGPDTIRFYERERLIPEPPRTSSGYRQYPADTPARLRFILRAKNLGFALKEIRELLSLRLEEHTCRALISLGSDARNPAPEGDTRTMSVSLTFAKTS